MLLSIRTISLFLAPLCHLAVAWEQQGLQHGYYTTGMQFLDEQVGYANNASTTAGDTVIFKSIDGGAHWSQISVGQQFSSISFINRDTGWVVGNRRISKTVDGGLTWVQRTVPISGKVKFIGADTGFIFGEN